MASAGFLAGLLLKDNALIGKIMGQSIIEESSVYKGAVAKGLAVGMQQGMQQGMQELILELLARKLGELSEPVKGEITTLTLEQLQSLRYDLLTFSSMADLTSWLKKNRLAET